VPLYRKAPGTPDATWKLLLKVSLYFEYTIKAQPPAIDVHNKAVVRHNWACNMGQAAVWQGRDESFDKHKLVWAAGVAFGSRTGVGMMGVDWVQGTSELSTIGHEQTKRRCCAVGV
jgi:hypothetical protein